MGSAERKNDPQCKNLSRNGEKNTSSGRAHGPAEHFVEAGTSAAQENRARLLHRIRSIRQQQGISIRCAARRLNLPVDAVKALENETSDMLLSTLYAWQRALDVPVGDLLVDRDGPLSEPVLKRARLVKLMKTAAAILAVADSDPLVRLSRMLVEQLIEIMPELKDVSPWHAVGQRRTLDEVGRIAERPFPENLFRDAAMHGLR